MPASLPIQENSDGVVTLTLTQPDRPVVVLDRALLEAIDAALDTIVSDHDPAGLVLASDSRVFVAGADLNQIMGLSDQELDEYLEFGQRVFGKIPHLPCTSVAALNGAALGGGLELAMHCDFIIASVPANKPDGTKGKPYAVGLPEAGLSICPGWGGTQTLAARVAESTDGPKSAITHTAMGTPYTLEQASTLGLIEAIVPADELLQHARAYATRQPPHRVNVSGGHAPRCIADTDIADRIRIGLEEAETQFERDGIHSEAAKAVLDLTRCGLDEGWQAGLNAERAALVRLRATDTAQKAIHAFLNKGK